MTTTYADDIRPKFRDQDIACMKGRHVLLADPTWMCDPAANHGFPDHGNARRVFAALSSGFMPPDGRWSQDWVDVYQAWIDGGFEPGPAQDDNGGGTGPASGGDGGTAAP